METLIYVDNLNEISGWRLTTDITLDWYWFKPTENNILKINPIYEGE